MEIKKSNEIITLDDDLIKLYHKYYPNNVVKTYGKKKESLDDLLLKWDNPDLYFLRDVTKLIKRRARNESKRVKEKTKKK